jgi:hypothetical protein
MKIRQLYEDKIKDLSKEIKEEIIKEAPHTQIVGVIPDSLSFLRGAFVDLGFENLQISKENKAAIHKAFIGNGVSIPGTNLKFRNTGIGVTVIEPDDGTISLPHDWFEAVLVLDGDKVSYAGKHVRPDQIG